ncbi:hypothetical protein PS914_03212 [Pseudomonas fluorescens]|uniref:hypothetical protein n=1 Tax=Pseudomonas fluorescens TaxID=294 RepID=UPI0012424A22|nr:hypothetical protein [Pseudomonas fluorescens]VVP91940.1 hypothetical protein PS914_03212 [Pseudomonas fluorescens]
MSKPVLSLKKKKQEPELKVEEKTEEALFNPLTIIEVSNWDYTPEEDFAPRQRKRRKDKETEQYRKESRWQ